MAKKWIDPTPGVDNVTPDGYGYWYGPDGEILPIGAPILPGAFHVDKTGKISKASFTASEHGDVKITPPKKGARFDVLPEDMQGASGDGRYGTTKLWGKYGASGVVIQSNGLIMLVQRGPGVSRTGKWQLPGGARNQNEDVYQGATREISEETGLPAWLLGEMEPIGEHVYEHPEGWTYTSILADLDIYRDDLEQIASTMMQVDGDETMAVRFFTPKQIRQMIADDELIPELAATMPAFLEHMDLKESSRESVLAGDFSGLTRIAGQKGSHEGAVYQAADGSQWYIKTAPSEEHGRSEVLTADLYALVRADGGNPIVVVGGEGAPGLTPGYQVASEWLEGSRRLNEDDLTGASWTIRARLREDFAADAWLANWDVAGTDWSNILMSRNQVPYRIDGGGALEFRALGAKKGQLFGTYVGEWDTLRDPDRNPYTAAIFEDISLRELAESVHKVVLYAKDDDIRQTVAKHGFPPELAEKLIARKQDLIRRIKAEVEAVKAKRVKGTEAQREFQERMEGADKEEKAMFAVAWRTYDHLSNSMMWRTYEPHRMGHDRSHTYDSQREFKRILESTSMYAGSGYGEINTWLRFGNDGYTYYTTSGKALHQPSTPNDPEAALEAIQDIDSALDRSVLTRDVLIYRGITTEALEHVGFDFEHPDKMVGLTWSDQAFQSWTARLATATEFGPDGTGSANAGVILRTVAPKGTHAIALSGYQSEAELLLERDVSIRVIGYSYVPRYPGSSSTSLVLDVEMTYNQDPLSRTYPELPGLSPDDEDIDNVFDEEGD